MIDGVDGEPTPLLYSSHHWPRGQERKRLAEILLLK